MQKRQKLFENEKQIVAAIEANTEKVKLKVQMMEQEEKASGELARRADEWEAKALEMMGRQCCPLCKGKGRGITHGDNFCYMCRGLGDVNQNALFSYAADLRQQSRYRHEQAVKLSVSVKRLADKVAPKLKRALAIIRTDALPLFDDQRPFGAVVDNS